MGNGRGKKLGAATLIAGVAVVGVFAATSAGRPVYIPLPEVELRLGGSFHPRSLPKQERVPVRLDLSGKLRTITGTYSTLRELVVEIDRNLQLNPTSVPACKDGNLNLDPEQVRDLCRGSIVGEGTAVIEFHFPENVPIPVPSDLTLLKGILPNGKRTLFLHSYPTVPSPKAVIGTVELRRLSRGRYGTEVTVSIPEIRDGHGYFRSFELTVPKQIGRDGEGSFATMRCGDGRILVRSRASFDEGLELRSTALRTCTPKPPAR